MLFGMGSFEKIKALSCTEKARLDVRVSLKVAHRSNLDAVAKCDSKVDHLSLLYLRISVSLFGKKDISRNLHSQLNAAFEG